MNFADAVLHVRDALAGNNAFPEAAIGRVMDGVQVELENSQFSVDGASLPLPWFLFEVNETLSYPADTESVALPDGFLAFEPDWPIKKVVEGVYTDLDFFSDMDATRGEPKVGVFSDGRNLYKYPTPTEDETLAISYYKRSTTSISTDATLPWLKEFPFLLINATAMNICRKHLRDTEGAKILLQDVANSARMYFTKVEEKKINMLEVTLQGRY